MIDFRYHLISIVAVLLALSIGIVMGTGVLGGPLLEDLENRVEEVRARNAELNAEIDQLQERIADQQRFAESVGDYLLPDSLADQDVVVVEFEGVGGGLVDETRDAVEDAGATIAANIKVNRKFGLQDQTDVDQLALALRSASSDPDTLRREAARELGARASVVAAPGSPSAGHRARFEGLIEELSDAGFISVSREDEDVTVPSGSSFLVLGGGESLPQYEPDVMAVELAAVLSRGPGGVLVAETSESEWGLTTGVIDDSGASDSVATVSGADTVQGRVAVVLALAEAISGSPGHYGSGDGSDGPLPEPGPSL